MDDDNRREENNDVSEVIKSDEIAGEQERGSDNRYQLIPRSFSNHRSKQTE